MRISKHRVWKVDNEFKWSEWYDVNMCEDDLCDPPLDAQMALDILVEYLLTRDKGYTYLTALPESTQQVNSMAVDLILQKYSKDFKKEIRNIERELCPTLWDKIVIFFRGNK